LFVVVAQQNMGFLLSPVQAAWAQGTGSSANNL
jgi:hypothetical protein